MPHVKHCLGTSKIILDFNWFVMFCRLLFVVLLLSCFYLQNIVSFSSSFYSLCVFRLSLILKFSVTWKYRKYVITKNCNAIFAKLKMIRISSKAHKTTIFSQWIRYIHCYIKKLEKLCSNSYFIFIFSHPRRLCYKR